MGFLSPSVPKPVPPANPATNPNPIKNDVSALPSATTSLVNTSAQGLERRATTQRRSLIGG